MANEIFFFYGLVGSAAVAACAWVAYRLSARSSATDPLAKLLADKNAPVPPVADVISFYRPKSCFYFLPKEVVLKMKALVAQPGNKNALHQENVKGLFEHLDLALNRYEQLEARRLTKFDEEKDIPSLRDLWCLAFGSDIPFQRESEEWSKLGFQGLDPQTDLRGGGMLALDQFLYFAHRHRAQFLEMIRYNEKQLNVKQPSWFLLAVVSIQFSCQLVTMECVPGSGRDKPSKGAQGFPKKHLQALYRSPEFAAAQAASGGESADWKAWVAKEQRKDESSSIAFGTGRPVPYNAFHELHSQLLMHFFSCWKKDSPSVMEYTQWVPKVFKEFFREEFPLEEGYADLKLPQPVVQ